jgi:predicted alpha/beta hydrolase
MFRNRSKKLISKDWTRWVRPGTNDDQKKKLAGVVAKQTMDVMADRVTDSAMCPRASIEKSLMHFLRDNTQQVSFQGRCRAAAILSK